MATAVAKPKNAALAAAQALKSNLKTVQANLPSGGGAYLKFGKDGVWSFGEGGASEIEKGKDELALNPLSIKTGWSCWTDYDKDPSTKGKKNELIDELLVPLGQPVPAKHKLKDTGWDWRQQIAVEFKALSGKHKGKTLKFATTSQGGTSMLNSLIEQILTQLDEDPEAIVPVIVVDSDHYQHKQWGKTYVPTFELVEFITMDGPTMNGEEEGDEEPDEEPDVETEEQDDDGVEDAEIVDAAVEEGLSEEAPVRRRRR